MDSTLAKKPKLAALQNAQRTDLEIDFDELFEQHWAGLCRTLTNLVGDRDEAQDLALEAFLRLHHKPPSDRRNLGGWPAVSTRTTPSGKPCLNSPS